MSTDITTSTGSPAVPTTDPRIAVPLTVSLDGLLHSIDQSSWIAAAAVQAIGGSGTPEQQSAAAAVLAAAEVEWRSEVPRADRAAVAAQAAAPVVQAAAYLRGGESWAQQPDEALLAQGRASARNAPAMVNSALPALPGLSQALAAPGARILDVGTGVAALAVAWAELLPAVTVVGIDVLPRVLALAEAVVAASPAAARVVLRQQDVSELDEEARYALVWLPAPFVPEVALRAGLGRIHRALTPGGWVIIGHGKFAGDPVASAVTRFKTLAYGGTALDEGQARELLQQTGFRDITTMPTPPGAPAVTVARTAT